jgi:predicted regulator of Ras-like GTPase activity (Roadblock/LC7/MglB family)
MDVTQALAELTELSSQVESAVVLDADGSVIGSTLSGEGATERLANVARDLATVALELHSTGGEVTRVEVELAEGAVFVLREGGRTIAARTGSRPTAGLVAYDLRTCLRGIDDAPKARRRRAPRKQQGESTE